MKYSREEAHRRLYALAVKFLNKHDPCGECPIKACKKPMSSPTWTPSKSWCCSGCKYLSKNGCTVDALGCRLHICGDGATKHTRHYVRKRLRTLKMVACKYDVWYARASSADVLSLSEPQDFWHLFRNSTKR